MMVNIKKSLNLIRYGWLAFRWSVFSVWVVMILLATLWLLLSGYRAGLQQALDTQISEVPPYWSQVVINQTLNIEKLDHVCGVQWLGITPQYLKTTMQVPFLAMDFDCLNQSLGWSLDKNQLLMGQNLDYPMNQWIKVGSRYLMTQKQSLSLKWPSIIDFDINASIIIDASWVKKLGINSQNNLWLGFFPEKTSYLVGRAAIDAMAEETGAMIFWRDMTVLEDQWAQQFEQWSYWLTRINITLMVVLSVIFVLVIKMYDKARSQMWSALNVLGISHNVLIKQAALESVIMSLGAIIVSILLSWGLLTWMFIHHNLPFEQFSGELMGIIAVTAMPLWGGLSVILWLGTCLGQKKRYNSQI